MCLAACAGANTPEATMQRRAEARRAIEAAPSVDLHSHAGGVASSRRMREGRPFGAVGQPMRLGGMAAICLAVVSDGPTHRVMSDGRIHAYREPDTGELWQYAQLAFGRVHDLARDQGLAVAPKRLRAARRRSRHRIGDHRRRGGRLPGGQIERVDEAFSKYPCAICNSPTTASTNWATFKPSPRCIPA